MNNRILAIALCVISGAVVLSFSQGQQGTVKHVLAAVAGGFMGMALILVNANRKKSNP